nr:hypothetical protein [uncultured bacterium]
MEDKESNGFYEAFYPFPNGTVHFITMLFPEDLGTEERTTTFVTVTVEDSIHTEIFRGINLIPVSEALKSTDSGTYIIVSGTKVDENNVL